MFFYSIKTILMCNDYSNLHVHYVFSFSRTAYKYLHPYKYYNIENVISVSYLHLRFHFFLHKVHLLYWKTIWKQAFGIYLPVACPKKRDWKIYDFWDFSVFGLTLLNIDDVNYWLSSLPRVILTFMINILPIVTYY